MTRATSKLRASDYEVRRVSLSVATDLVVRHHYAGGGSNTGTFVHGLFGSGSPDCLGVAWWIPPTKGAAIATWDGDWRRVLALSRLVCVPEAPKNAASFLIGRSVALIAATGLYDCLVTYADEWQGHTGAIYRATNWEYVGLTNKEAVWVDEGGRMTARKAGPRTRTNAEMADLGHEQLGRFAKHKYRMDLTAHRRYRRREGTPSLFALNAEGQP